jgi:predicted metalloprotease with PDZ domain
MREVQLRNLLVITILLFSALTFTKIVQGQPEHGTLNANKLIYILEPIIRGENSRFRVDCYFKGGESGTSKLVLPLEWDRQKRLYKQITNLHAASANTRILDTSDPHIKSISHYPSAVVHIQYDVVQDWNGSAVKDGLYNRAVLQKNYFYFIGNTFWVYPDWDRTKQLSIQLHWKNFPQTWSLADSFGTGKMRQTIKSSLQNFIKGVYLGGDFRIKALTVRSKSIYTATRGRWKFSDEEFQSLVQRIMNVERAFWNDDDFLYYLIVLFPTDDANTSGEARTDSFVLYIPKDVETVSVLKFTLAHELFHLWNPIRLGGLESERLYWFSEGLTDYYASLLLLRAGLVSLDEYVSGVNELLKLYYTSPARNLTNEQILIARRDSYEAERQPYQRGNLLAYNWNALIKSATGNKYSLDDVLRSLFKASRQKRFVLSESSIDNAFRVYLKEGIRSDIREYMEKGNTIVPLEGMLGACFVKRMIEVAPFDAGFDIEATLADRVFRGVREDSNAYKAGMRNGQKWIDGGMERDPAVMAEFTVEESGARKTVRYYPAGNNRNAVPQFGFKSGEGSPVSRSCQSWFDGLARN